MAMTATIAVLPTTVVVNAPATVTLTVSNSSATDINMTGIKPTALYTGAPKNDPAACALGVPELSAGATILVPAGSTLTFQWQVVFFAKSGSTTYDLGAECNSQDGSVFRPTVCTITVT